MRLIDADALKKSWSMADKCEDCTQDARHCRYEQDFTRMDICEMLDEAPTVTGWISVEDRLPEPGYYVLMCLRDVFTTIGLHTGQEWVEKGTGQTIPVTHWMPLPEPPEEVSGDG